MQVNSDSRPSQEYLQFLTTGAQEYPPLPDQPSIIIGQGRIGSLLASLGGGKDVIVKRGESIPADHPGPIYICTRNDVLEDVIKSCPENKREDLVFLQNGMIEPLLRKFGLEKASKANIYFAVPKIGAEPKDGKTDTDPDGLTAATGKWAFAFQERITKADLSCKVLFERDFRRSMFEKLIWISAFMLVGSVHGNIPVGDVEKFHKKEVEEMIEELTMFVRFTTGCALLNGTVNRCCAYARAVADFPTALKEFEWRNGWFYEYSLRAREKGIPSQTPMHDDYLEDGKARGLISW